jgi:hypothetical protein
MTGMEVYNEQHIARIRKELKRAIALGDTFMVSHLMNKLHGEHTAVIEFEGDTHE